MSAGTPKSLNEAMQRCLVNADTVVMGHDEAKDLATELEPHVRDFLAQKFATAICEARGDEHERALHLLWEAITGKKIGEK